MFYSTYVPVNVNRNNCAVYSSEKVFDKTYLMKAKKFLQTGNEPGVFIETGCVSFTDQPNVKWTIPEIYLAYKALESAEQNGISFYVVRDMDKIPQLFISSNLKPGRLLINATTFRSVLLQDSQYTHKVTCLIDRCYPWTYCQELYSILESLQNGETKHLTALITAGGTPDETLILSPYIVPYGDIIKGLGLDSLIELRSLLNREFEQTESYCIEGEQIHRVDLAHFPVMSLAYVQSLLEMYQSCKEKKSNYVPIINQDGETSLYFSTNSRYLVNARTLEQTTVKNASIIELLKVMSNRAENPSADLSMVWEMARVVN